MRRVEFSIDEDTQKARCECFDGDRMVTVFWAPVIKFPMPSEHVYVDHPLFSFHLRRTE